ncbi:PQQ enzyme repeat-containing protein [Halovivax ruber XH-70]|uniref:PQQ enzyme repeat-containing protein n=1 Tax=Halovivax ruber (strain DSM 18193 / JCM 13892 / XH-70) TaxID=797302 RepID=L0IFN0_HALRX|nr:PQQ-binding-like beta-propeller repeat protein [Halovivax ruber]AGB17031.1 PQQ enzyme repeat-containing protein [Halovivax ruber XH-70]
MPSRRRFVAGAGGLAAAVVGVRAVRSDGLEPAPTDWPMPRHDAAGTGHNPAGSGPTDDVAVRWERETDDSFAGPAPPILVDGTLFAVGRRTHAAFDAATGERRFDRKGSYTSAPSWVGSNVYQTDTLAVTGRDGIFGLNAGGGYEVAGWSIGAERWHAPGRDPAGRLLGSPIATAPVAVDNTVIAAVPETRRFVALHGDSGRIEWEHTVGDTFGDPLHRPAVRDGVAYLASWPNFLHAVDVDSGDSLWEVELDADEILPPTATSEGVVVPDWNAVVLVDPTDGQTRWTYEYDGNATDGSAAVANDTVFLTDGDGFLHAIDLASGDEVWSVEYTRQVDPIVADGVVYVAYNWTNEVTAFDAATGDRLWTWESPYGLSQPIVGDGVLYAAGHERIVALEEA